MRDFIKVAIGILIAFFLHTALGKISLPLALLFNFFSLVVIYFALSKGEVYGSCLGAFCGLLQDSFSLGVFGVAGLAKTITGFLAGYISRKINVSPPMRSFVLIFILVSLEFILWTLMRALVFSERVQIGQGLIFFQPFSTALLGSLLFRLLKKIDRNGQKQ